jgi:hypothetical protein
MKQPEFAHHYATLTDDELAAINLADLVPEARSAYETERVRRLKRMKDEPSQLEEDSEDKAQIGPFFCLKCKQAYEKPVADAKGGLLARLVRNCPQGHKLGMLNDWNTSGPKSIFLGMIAVLLASFAMGIALTIFEIDPRHPLGGGYQIGGPPAEFVIWVLSLMFGVLLAIPALCLARWWRWRASGVPAIQEYAKGLLSGGIGAASTVVILLVIAYYRR